jgi:hypothetical protein
MSEIAEKLIKDVSEELIILFKEDYIQKYVYDSHGDNEVYFNPKGQEFKESWEWEEIKRSATQVSRMMFHNPDKMSSIPDYFGFVGVHGSMVDGWDSDERSYLPEVLNKRGYSSKLWVSVSRPAGYWTMFLNHMIVNKKLNFIVAKHAIKYGLKLGGI